MRLLLSVAALIGVAFLSFTITSLLLTSDSGAVRAAGTLPSRARMDEVMAKLKAEQQADAARPQFSGPLGPFVIVATDKEASPANFCTSGVGPGKTSNFLSSELNKPDMWEQMVCNDGVVAATYSRTGKRAYFRREARVAPKAPLERLKLTDIDGLPALIVAPPTTNGPFFVYAIVRQATSDIPGVLIPMARLTWHSLQTSAARRTGA